MRYKGVVAILLLVLVAGINIFRSIPKGLQLNSARNLGNVACSIGVELGPKHPASRDSIIDRTPSFDHRPRVLLSTGCTGSSVTITLVKRMLEAHYGVDWYRESLYLRSAEEDADRTIYFELYKEGKNFLFPIVRDRLGPEATKQEILHESIRIMHAEALALNQVFVFKLRPDMKDTLHFLESELHARVTMSLRANAIDWSLCNIRDCFQKKGQRVGVPVYAHNGSETNLCFERRTLAQTKQEVIQANCTHGVWPKEVSRLDHQTRKARVAFESAHPGNEAQVYEDLYSYSYSGTPANDTRSVESWIKLLKPLVDHVNQSIIEDILQEGRRTRRPPSPHFELIYNSDEAVRDLREAAPNIAEQFWRI